mgnify:CR=1 FL=1
MAEDLPASSALKQKVLSYGSDGSDAYPLLVDNTGRQIVAAPFTKTSVTWTADDGTAEVDMTLAAGAYWVHAVGWENADDAGSTTFQIHGSTETGFTPGANREEFYTSDAAIAEPNGAYEAFLAPVPITVPVAAKVYWRVIPDAGTTTGALDIYTTPNQ